MANCRAQNSKRIFFSEIRSKKANIHTAQSYQNVTFHFMKLKNDSSIPEFIDSLCVKKQTLAQTLTIMNRRKSTNKQLFIQGQCLRKKL